MAQKASCFGCTMPLPLPSPLLFLYTLWLVLLYPTWRYYQWDNLYAIVHAMMGKTTQQATKTNTLQAKWHKIIYFV